MLQHLFQIVDTNCIFFYLINRSKRQVSGFLKQSKIIDRLYRADQNSCVFNKIGYSILNEPYNIKTSIIILMPLNKMQHQYNHRELPEQSNAE